MAEASAPQSQSPYEFTRVLGVSSTSVLIGGEFRELADERVPHGFVIQFDRTFRRRWFLERWLVSIQPGARETGQFLFVCADGAILSSAGGEIREFDLGNEQSGTSESRMLRSADKIGQTVVAVGMSRTVYQRESSGKWTRLSDEIEVDRPEESGVGFTSVASAAPGELCCVGLRGEVWIRSNKLWDRCDVPTNCDLTCVSVDPDGDYIIGGTNGTLLKGNSDKWQVVADGSNAQSITDIATFADDVFVADGSRLMKLEGGDLKSVETALDSDPGVRYLSSTDNALWAITRERAIVLSNGSWAEFEVGSPRDD